MSSRESKRVATSAGITISSNHIRGCRIIFPTTPTLVTGSIPALDLVSSAMPAGNLGIRHMNAALLNDVFVVEFPSIK